MTYILDLVSNSIEKHRNLHVLSKVLSEEELGDLLLVVDVNFELFLAQSITKIA